MVILPCPEILAQALGRTVAARLPLDLDAPFLARPLAAPDTLETGALRLPILGLPARAIAEDGFLLPLEVEVLPAARLAPVAGDALPVDVLLDVRTGETVGVALDAAHVSLALPCLAMPRPDMPCRATPRRAQPSRAAPSRAPPRLLLLILALPCLAWPCRARPCHAVPGPAWPDHAMPCRAPSHSPQRET